MANSSAVEIVGEASDGRGVVEAVAELEPDVLIIDVELPKRDGIEATKEVLRVRPLTKVIIFTAHAQPDLLALALRAGASGYVLKSAPAEDIAKAVEAVTSGGTFLGGDFAGGKPSEVEKLLDLSPRESADPRAPRRGPAGQGDRRPPLAQPGDGPHPRPQRDRQARGRHPHRGGGPGRPLQLPGRRRRRERGLDGRLSQGVAAARSSAPARPDTQSQMMLSGLAPASGRAAVCRTTRACCGQAAPGRGARARRFPVLWVRALAERERGPGLFPRHPPRISYSFSAKSRAQPLMQ